MKKVLYSALAASFVAFSAFTTLTPAAKTAEATVTAPELVPTGKAKTLNVNTSASTLQWHAKKVTGEHMGTVKLSKGSLQVENNMPTAGTFVIDMQSIVCTDITDPGYNAKFIGHMKSDDFFSVEKHPTATFKAVGFGKHTNAVAGKPNYTVRGELTIKGITHMISIPATITQEGENLRTVADFTIDRSKWDIRYGSTSFFEGLGDKAIYDDIQFTLNMVTKAS